MSDPTKQPTPQVVIAAQVYEVPSSARPTYHNVQPVQQSATGYWNMLQKNKPQANSAGAASLIFISGGMNMPWNFEVAYGPHYILMTKHLILSWFIGGIIGVVIGAIACNYIPKKFIMGLASILVAICGILQVADSKSYDAILASRYLNGIALGLIFPMTFALIGEEIVKSVRGTNAAAIDTVCFNCGIFIQIICSAAWPDNLLDTSNFSSIQMRGVLNIIYGVVAFIMGNLLLVESPVFYLSYGNEDKALDSLRCLQRPFIITQETIVQLEEHKSYLAESKETIIPNNIINGIPALLKLCFYRSFNALGFSILVNFIFTYSSTFTSFQVYPFIWYAIARLLGPLFVMFTLDSKGRKLPTIVGFFICTALAFAVGGVIFNKQHLDNIDYLDAVKYILIAFQLFASMSMTSSSAYLSEAFPLAVKSYFVAIVFIVEMLVHIIIISCMFNEVIIDFSGYFLTLGALSLVFLAVTVFCMPETKGCSLRECLPKFRANNFS